MAPVLPHVMGIRERPPPSPYQFQRGPVETSPALQLAQQGGEKQII